MCRGYGSKSRTGVEGGAPPVPRVRKVEVPAQLCRPRTQVVLIAPPLVRSLSPLPVTGREEAAPSTAPPDTATEPLRCRRSLDRPRVSDASAPLETPCVMSGCSRRSAAVASATKAAPALLITAGSQTPSL